MLKVAEGRGRSCFAPTSMRPTFWGVLCIVLVASVGYFANVEENDQVALSFLDLVVDLKAAGLTRSASSKLGDEQFLLRRYDEGAEDPEKDHFQMESEDLLAGSHTVAKHFTNKAVLPSNETPGTKADDGAAKKAYANSGAADLPATTATSLMKQSNPAAEEVTIKPPKNYAPGEFLSLEQVKQKHSFCFSEDIITRSEMWGDYLDVNATGHFVVNSAPPKYDHLSCFVMKARYNCAIGPGNPDPYNATSHKLVLKSPKEANTSSHSAAQEVCDLQQLVDDFGGPLGLARYLRDQQESGKRDMIPSFFMQGNSFIRQVWESLTCSYRDHITNMSVVDGGPAAVNFVKGFKVSRADMGKPLVGIHTRQPAFGCHGYPSKEVVDRFYRPGVTKPNHTGFCNDDLAMLELDGAIRFYYVYHDEHYAQQRDIYDALGLHPSHVVGFIANFARLTLQHFGRLEKDAPELYLHYNRSMLRDRAYEYLDPEVLKRLRRRDTNKWPSPDGSGQHPCMPGLPDDIVRLVILCVLRGVRLKAG